MITAQPRELQASLEPLRHPFSLGCRLVGEGLGALAAYILSSWLLKEDRDVPAGAITYPSAQGALL